ncbi:MAG: SurA N-terminal domain-containing protein [Candidatus Omnitrophota bacterium]
MLKFFRKKKTMKITFWFIAVIIISAFALWGIPSVFEKKSGSMPQYAGEIFGHKININKFIDAYHAARNQAIMTYGQDYQKYAQFMNLEQDAWNHLILLAAAKEAKITVSNKEVINTLQSFPFFQKDGKFNLEIYNLLLQRVFNTTAPKFEEEIRQTLTLQKLAAQQLADVDVSDEETENAYAKENDTVQATYILVKNDDFKNGVAASDEEIKNYYQNNEETFKKPKQVNVKYIKIDPAAQTEGIEITDEEVENYYEENKEQFIKSPEENKTEEVQSPETGEYKTLDEVKEQIKNTFLAEKSRDKALDKAYEAYDFIADENSFEDAAKKFSLPLGETGFFSSSEPIAEIGWSYQFLTAAFQLEKGEISDVIETPKGFYITELIATREPHIPLLEEIKDDARTAYIAEKAKEKAKEKAQNILAEIKELQNKEKDKFDFSKTTADLGFAAQNTEEFKRDGYVQNIGQSKELTEEAFSLQLDQISSIIETPKGFVILILDEKKPFDKAKFAEEKEGFKQNLLQGKRQQRYSEWFDKLKEGANLKSNLSSLMKQ